MDLTGENMACVQQGLEDIQKNASSSLINPVMHYLFFNDLNQSDINCNNASVGATPAPGNGSDNLNKFCEEISPGTKFWMTVLFGATLPYMIGFLIIASIPPRRKDGQISKFSAVKSVLNFTTRRRHIPEAALFLLIAERFCPLLSKYHYWDPPGVSDHFPSVPISLLNALLIMVVYFPLLVAASHYTNRLALWFGFVFLIPLIWLSAYEWQECMDILKMNYIYLALLLPKLLCQVILFFSFMINFIFPGVMDTGNTCIRYKCVRDVHEKYSENYHTYTRQLFQQNRQIPTSRLQRFIQRYREFTAFTFSNKVVCTLVASVVALNKMYLVVLRRQESMFSGIDHDLKVWYPIFHLTKNTTWVYDTAADFIHTTELCLAISCHVSYGLHYCFIIQMFFSYRQHMLRLYRGDNTWYNCKKPNMTLSLMYPGYQAGYVIFGFCGLHFVTIIFAFLFALGIAVPVRHGIHSSIGQGFISLWPGIVCTIVISVLQGIFCKIFLIRNKDEFTVHNRVCYDIMSYIFFALHTVQGLFCCLQRSLMTIILWGAMLCRLDRFAMSRTLEGSDPGIETYISMLHMDLHHSHPVMLTFVDLMKSQAAMNHPHTEETALLVNTEARVCPKRRRHLNRWFKAVTLIRNPSLQRPNQMIMQSLQPKLNADC